MAGDVKALRVTATGAVTSVPSRIKGLNIQAGATAGRVTLTNGNGGATLLDLDVPASATWQMFVEVPEDGIYASSSIYLGTLTAATGVTVFYQ